MKTELTKALEKAIFKASKADCLGIYGAFEVAIGKAYGNEYVDYMTMSSGNEFRCYEIKVSYSDFNSNNKLSFYGDFNYFVLPWELWEKIKDLRRICDPIGVYAYKDGHIKLVRKAKRKILRIDDRVMLMHCMIRSLSRLTTKMIKNFEG